MAGRAAVEKGGGVARPSGDDEEASSKSVRYHRDRFCPDKRSAAVFVR